MLEASAPGNNPTLVTESIEVVPGLVRVGTQDIARINKLLSNVWNVKEVWDDEARSNPTLWFASHYLNPNNMLFEVDDGNGFIAFIRTIPTWRTQVYTARWGGSGKSYDEHFLTACRIMVLAHDLLVIDAFILPDNEPARAAAERSGFADRGTVAAAQCYNGAMRPMCWYEIHRNDLGV